MFEGFAGVLGSVKLEHWPVMGSEWETMALTCIVSTWWII